MFHDVDVVVVSPIIYSTLTPELCFCFPIEMKMFCTLMKTTTLVLWLMNFATASAFFVTKPPSRTIIPSTSIKHKNFGFIISKHKKSTTTTNTAIFGTFMESLNESMSKALSKKEVKLVASSGAGSSGGGGASTCAVVDEYSQKKYFVKSAAGPKGSRMLYAEYLGVKEMANSNTIRVPEPICFDEYVAGGNIRAFVIFEFLEFTRMGKSTDSEYELGKKLAQMHRTFSPNNNQYGFICDNTIGATPQPNTWMDSWEDFWIDNRLGHMLKLTGDVGYDKATIDKLKQKTRELISHNPEPSLIHGDLCKFTILLCLFYMIYFYVFQMHNDLTPLIFCLKIIIGGGNKGKLWRNSHLVLTIFIEKDSSDVFSFLSNSTYIHTYLPTYLPT